MALSRRFIIAACAAAGKGATARLNAAEDAERKRQERLLNLQDKLTELGVKEGIAKEKNKNTRFDAQIKTAYANLDKIRRAAENSGNEDVINQLGDHEQLIGDMENGKVSYDPEKIRSSLHRASLGIAQAVAAKADAKEKADAARADAKEKADAAKAARDAAADIRSEEYLRIAIDNETREIDQREREFLLSQLKYVTWNGTQYNRERFVNGIENDKNELMRMNNISKMWRDDNLDDEDIYLAEKEWGNYLTLEARIEEKKLKLISKVDAQNNPSVEDTKEANDKTISQLFSELTAESNLTEFQNYYNDGKISTEEIKGILDDSLREAYEKDGEPFDQIKEWLTKQNENSNAGTK